MTAPSKQEALAADLPHLDHEVARAEKMAEFIGIEPGRTRWLERAAALGRLRAALTLPAEPGKEAPREAELQRIIVEGDAKGAFAVVSALLATPKAPSPGAGTAEAVAKLIERLRNPEWEFRHHSEESVLAEGNADLMLEAASTLADVQERVEFWRNDAKSTQRSLEAAEARAEKLAGALNNFVSFGCPVCSGDCASANPPVSMCPMQEARAALQSPAEPTGGPQ